jgi:cytochrome c553
MLRTKTRLGGLVVLLLSTAAAVAMGAKGEAVDDNDHHEHEVDHHEREADHHGHAEDRGHPTHAPDSGHPGDLKTIMIELGQDMTTLGDALWLEDWAGLAAASKAIADHPHVSPTEKARVSGVLGADFADFVIADRAVHDSAVRLSEAAASKDMKAVLDELSGLQSGCVDCHGSFRNRLNPGQTATGDRGAAVFAAQCAICHGPEGRGDGVEAAEHEPPPSDLVGPRAEHLRGIPRRSIIEEGSPGTAMVGWKSILSPEDLDAVYGFVHDLKHGSDGEMKGRGRGEGRGAGMGRGRGGKGRGHRGPGASLNVDPGAEQRARSAIQTLGSSLKGRLVSTMKAQGPVAALDVCSTEAQTLTAEVAHTQGVLVGRSSLRLRNPANAPPDWVGRWLQEQGESAAEGVAGITRAATLDDGSQVVRVLKPLAIEAPCLVCHGPKEGRNAELAATLANRYPEDAASGYAVGDLRGAMWAEARVDSAQP